MDEQQLAAHHDQIQAQGFTIVEGVLDAASVARLLEVMNELMDSLEISFGANAFLGFRTRRIFNLLARHPAFQRIPLDPTILALVERVLDPSCLLSSLTAIEMHAGQAPQPFHADDGSIPLPRPHVPLTCIAIWALTDFTPDNGATRIVPASHRFDRIPRKGEEPAEVVTAEMTAGSVLVYNGSMWHGGGANRTGAPRIGVAMNYCAGYIRQQENQQLGIPASQVARMPRRLQELVGYGIYNGLIGHIDKQPPGALLARSAAARGTSGESASESPMVWDVVG